MFQNAHHFRVDGGTFTVQQDGSGSTHLQLLHQKAVSGAVHDSAERYPPPRCHPDTRKRIIGEIMDWINDLSRSSSVLWVNGPAGAGKTAIAQNVCEICQSAGHPVGDFFFSRMVHGRNNPLRLFTTIAYQLAISIPDVGKKIEEAVSKDPSIVDKAMEIQLQKLILEPLHAVDISARPVVIVIDGLDECEGESMQCHILQLLAAVFQHGIVPICFIVASRPESWIREEFNRGLLFRNTRPISLEESPEVNEDIHTFFRAGFEEIHDSSKHRYTMANVPKPWPDENALADLVERASGQFIYPATVLKFVGDPNYRPQDRLSTVLAIPAVKEAATPNPLAELDRLYAQILSTCPDKRRTLDVLGTTLAVREASRHLCQEWTPEKDLLSVVENLIDLRPGDGYLALRTIHSLIKVNRSTDNDSTLDGSQVLGDQDLNDAVIFYHKSFVDFILNEERSGEYFVDMGLINTRLTFACLERMKTLSSLPGPPTRIDYLAWGCAVLQWVDHCVSSSACSIDNVLAALEDFDWYSCFVVTLGDRRHKECEDYLVRLALPKKPGSSPSLVKRIYRKIRGTKTQHLPPSVHVSPNISDIEKATAFLISQGAINDILISRYARLLHHLVMWLKNAKKPRIKLITQYTIAANILTFYGSRKARRGRQASDSLFTSGVLSRISLATGSLSRAFQSLPFVAQKKSQVGVLKHEDSWGNNL